MHFGEMEVRYLDGGPFGLDGGAMFGVVPKTLWEKRSPPDDKNRIRMRANSLLVRTAGKTIVIETGNGTKLEPKLKSIYNVGDGDPLSLALHKNGVEPKDVDVVINTHLHFDHAGGNTHFFDGRAVPTFPRARYIVQKNELDHAFHATERDRASYFIENYQPMIDSKQWDLVDGAAQIMPGISVERIPGHNADLQAVKLSSGGKTLVFVADLLPTRHHIPLPWIMAYDLYPLQSLETKRKWIPQIVKEGWIVVFGHDPDTAAATLHDRDGKIEVEPVELNR